MLSPYITIPEALGISVLGFAIVFVVLAVLILVVKVISLVSSPREKARQAPAPTAQSAPSTPSAPSMPPAPGSAGSCDLNGVDDRTAAMLMAIVANQMGAPLNELRFLSIKEV